MIHAMTPQSIALVIGLVIFLLLVGFHGWMGHIARRAQGQAVTDLPAGKNEALHKQGRLVLYFYTPHCGHCKSMTPRIDSLAQQYDHLFKVDVSQARPWVAALNVRATPTTVLISDGIIQRVLLGPLSDQAIVQLLR